MGKDLIEREGILRVIKGKNKGKEYLLTNKPFFIGNQEKDDVFLEEGEPIRLVIEKINGFYVFKTLTDRGLIVSDEEDIYEKILVNQDKIKLINSEFEFVEKKDKVSDIIKKKIYKIILAVLVLVFAILFMVFYDNKSDKNLEFKSNYLYTDDTYEKFLLDVDARVRRAQYKESIADKLYSEKELDAGNLYRAVVLYKKVLDLVSPIPKAKDFYENVKIKYKKCNQEFNERLNYLKNNAYIALKRGDYLTAKIIFEKIIQIVPDPSNEIYVFSKNNLTKIYYIEQRGLKNNNDKKLSF